MERTCWTCQHLLSKVGALPPVLCKAFPKGISIEILSGVKWHDKLFGDEKEKVFYDPITEEEITRRQKEVDKESGTIDTLSLKTKRLLLKSIFFGNQEWFNIYLKFYDEAVTDGSEMPHERAMIKFREYYAETPTGWVLRPGMVVPQVEALEEGGMGSGNWGHISVDGKRGGSLKGTGGKDKKDKYVKKVKKGVDLDKYTDELAAVFSNWKQDDQEKMVLFTKDGTMIVIGSGDRGQIGISMGGIQQILKDNGAGFHDLKYVVHNHNKGEAPSKGDVTAYKAFMAAGFGGDYQVYTPKTQRVQDVPYSTGKD